MNETKDIIIFCKQGKREGFELLVRKFAPMLKGVAMRYTRDESTAKDVLQETFILVFKHIMTYADQGNFEAWLKKITINCALKSIRSSRKKLGLVIQMDESEYPEYGVDPGIFEKFDFEDILGQLDKLPIEERLVFNMYIVEGYAYKEISELLQITESHARMRVSRARKKIQKILIEQKAYYEVAKS